MVHLGGREMSGRPAFHLFARPSPAIMGASEARGTENAEVLQALGLLEELFKTAKESVSIRNYRIFILRYGLDGEKPQTLQAVGKRFNISKTRVDQIAKSVIRKTRSAFRMKLVFREIEEGGKWS